MRKNVSVACLLFAWLCANGAVWDIVQVVAWGKMFAGYATNMSVTAAIEETFDLTKPCPLCLSVSAAKNAEQKQTAAPQSERAATRIDLVCEAATPIVFASNSNDWPAVLASTAPDRVELVPVPPPRV